MPSPGYEIGKRNREAVRQWFKENLGGTRRECGKALGLSAESVGRHLKAINNG